MTKEKNVGAKKGRGRAARNKTPGELYGGKRSEKSEMPRKMLHKMSSGEKFLKHFKG